MQNHDIASPPSPLETIGQSRVMLHSDVDPADLTSADTGTPTFTLHGATTHFYVYFEDALGAAGQNLADAVLASCEPDYQFLGRCFDNLVIGGPEFHVYIQRGNKGGRHATCPATALYIDAFNGTDADLVRSLVVAEAAEVFMDAQVAGWNCAASNGEGLSRILAAEQYINELNPPGLGITFATAAKWLDNGRPNFVDNTDPSDTNFVSIGCATLFINWLQYQLGYSLQQIIAAGGPNLGKTYTLLTGRADGFDRFSALLNHFFPTTPSGLQNDNPFPLADPTPGFPLLTLTSGAFIYPIAPDGTLRWYRQNGWSNGEFSWQGPSTVGRGWGDFKHVFGGGANTLYAVDAQGNLNWYMHNAFNTGEGLGTPGAWANDGLAQVVGHGWQDFLFVFSPGGGVMYAIDPQGNLNWYRHYAFTTGGSVGTSGAWANDGLAKVVGHGWQDVREVFACLAPSQPGTGFPDAIIYAVAQDGTLNWYRHKGAADGAGIETPGAWENGGLARPVGRGWQTFARIVSTGDGVIYGVDASGTLRRYRHAGFGDGLPVDTPGAWEEPHDVAYGWQIYPSVAALTPGLPSAPA